MKKLTHELTLTLDNTDAVGEHMTLDRDTVLRGIEAELGAFAELLRSLSDRDLQVPTRCEGWSVSDVAGHVVGTVVDITVGNLDGQGTPPVTDRQARERRGRSADQLADELDAARPTLTSILNSLDEDAFSGPSPIDPKYTLGFGVEAIWYDAYLHADDIRAALGRPSERGAGLRCAVHHVAGYLEGRGWEPMTLALVGLEPVPVAGGGSETTADPLDFVLAATGRRDPRAIGLDPRLNVYAD